MGARPWEHEVCNTLSEYNGWVLNQKIKGVPIGGSLSTQLMCLLAPMQGITFLNNPHKSFDEVSRK